MAELTARRRNKLPSSSFALPGKGEGPKGKGAGSYPIPDESHARNALARVSQHGTPAEKAKVRSAVARKFPGVEQSPAKKANSGNSRNPNNRLAGELTRRLDQRSSRPNIPSPSRPSIPSTGDRRSTDRPGRK
jgi:hypothetical protein